MLQCAHEHVCVYTSVCTRVYPHTLVCPSLQTLHGYLFCKLASTREGAGRPEFGSKLVSLLSHTL